MVAASQEARSGEVGSGGAVPGGAALGGVRILDFTQMMLGPFCTQFLADYGADVIKVERPKVGEWERGLRAMGKLLPDGNSPFFAAMNRNKRSLALDLKSRQAIDLIYELIPQVDVVVENYRPGVMDRLGLGYEKLAAINPALVYASGSGYGSSGPYISRPGQDLIIQGLSGMAANTGRAGDLPTPLGTAIVDASTALMLAMHIMIALYHRQVTGRGQKVETSLFNTALAVQCQELSAFANLGLRWERSAAGIAQAWLEAPYGVYPTLDGPITLAMNPLAKLAEVLDMPGLLAYDDAEKAYACRDEIMEQIAAVTAGYRRDELLTRLLAADMWCGPVQDFDDVMQDPQALHNEMFVQLESPEAGSLTLVGAPGKLSATPAAMRLPPPQVGEHTDAVLAEFGLAPERVHALRTEGVIG